MTTLITPLPTPPTRQDPSNFNDRADDFLGALPLFQQEANGLAIDVQSSADEVEISRQAVVSVTNISKWISGNTYLEGSSVWSPINGVAYRKMTSSVGGTTDPSNDSTNYKSITDASGFIYKPAGTGAVVATVEQELNRMQVNILRFGADPTGVELCNDALNKAKAVCKTVYLPPGTYRIENYALEDLRLIGAGTDGANYGNFTTIIEGSGDIFTQANNFSMEHITIRNKAAGTLGKLISVKDIDTSIGPIRYCNFLRANYHIYHSSATKTIVGAAIHGCLFREAVLYSRYYANAGLFQYSEFDCYTQANNRGLFIQGTSTALISASVFEFQDAGGVYVVNTSAASDTVSGLKFQNIHFEHNGNITPTADVTINISPSLARIEFDSCGFYASTLAGNIELSSSPNIRIYEHNTKDASYSNINIGAVITQVMPKVTGETSGLKTTHDIIAGAQVKAGGGFSNNNILTTTIYNTDTPTKVEAPPSYAAKLVVANDATSGGAALLLLTSSGVNLITTTISNVTFSIVSGFLNAKTTGGSSFRNMFFAQLST